MFKADEEVRGSKVVHVEELSYVPRSEPNSEAVTSDWNRLTRSRSKTEQGVT